MTVFGSLSSRPAQLGLGSWAERIATATSSVSPTLHELELSSGVIQNRNRQFNPKPSKVTWIDSGDQIKLHLPRESLQSQSTFYDKPENHFVQTVNDQKWKEKLARLKKAQDTARLSCDTSRQVLGLAPDYSSLQQMYKMIVSLGEQAESMIIKDKDEQLAAFLDGHWHRQREGHESGLDVVYDSTDGELTDSCTPSSDRGRVRQPFLSVDFETDDGRKQLTVRTGVPSHTQQYTFNCDGSYDSIISTKDGATTANLEYKALWKKHTEDPSLPCHKLPNLGFCHDEFEAMGLVISTMNTHHAAKVRAYDNHSTDGSSSCAVGDSEQVSLA